jgi:hypothetical protein
LVYSVVFWSSSYLPSFWGLYNTASANYPESFGIASGLPGSSLIESEDIEVTEFFFKLNQYSLITDL